MTLLTLKTNIVGTAAVAVLSSVTTVLVSHWVAGAPVGDPVAVVPSTVLPAAPGGTGSVALACGDLIYSPVQRTCVDQQTFDAEMKRLFAALGLNAGIYASDVADR